MSSPVSFDFFDRVVNVHFGEGAYVLLNVTAVTYSDTSALPVDPRVSFSYPPKSGVKLLGKHESYARQSTPGTVTPRRSLYAWYSIGPPLPSLETAGNTVTVDGITSSYIGQFVAHCYLPNTWFLPDGTQINWPGAYNYGANGSYTFGTPEAQAEFLNAYNAFFGEYSAASTRYALPDGTVVTLPPPDTVVPLVGGELAYPPIITPGSAQSNLTAEYLLYVPPGAASFTTTIAAPGRRSGSTMTASLYPQASQRSGITRPSQITGSPVVQRDSYGVATTIYSIATGTRPPTLTITADYSADGGGGGGG